jgi:hypothetical protein
LDITNGSDCPPERASEAAAMPFIVMAGQALAFCVVIAGDPAMTTSAFDETIKP